MISAHHLIEALVTGGVMSGHEYDGRDKNKAWVPLHENHDGFAEFCAGNIINSQCFDVGDQDDIPRLKIEPSLFNTPYDQTYFEMVGDGEANGEFGQATIGVFMSRTTDEDRAWITAAFAKYQNLPALWTYGGCCVVKVEDDEVIVYPISHVNVMGENARVPEFAQPNTDINRKLMRQLALKVGQFLMAVNCSNTKLREIKAPKRINASRKKKGKVPLFSHWVLEIPNAGGSEGAGIGTHASPRVHLRRGHVRQYAPGKFTWVQPCVVGDRSRGMVTKTYQYERAT